MLNPLTFRRGRMVAVSRLKRFTINFTAMQNHATLFGNLSENSRVWIYQSSRAFTAQEAQEIAALVREFVQQWTSHSEKVVADGALVYSRFIVFAADESFVSLGGCSIDSSVKMLRQVEQQFNTTLFDRLSVAYRENDIIKTAPQAVFQQLVDEGKVTGDTRVYNNLVSTLKDFRQKWETPLSQSWHARMFAGAKV